MMVAFIGVTTSLRAVGVDASVSCLVFGLASPPPPLSWTNYGGT